jgi:hypothetical protein
VAAALTSRLTDPIMLGLTYPKVEAPTSYPAGDSMIIKPSEQKRCGIQKFFLTQYFAS